MKTSSTSGKGRARRARSLTATLGVMATIAALSIPAAMPASASAMADSRAAFCNMAAGRAMTAYLNGNESEYIYWSEVFYGARCHW